MVSLNFPHPALEKHVICYVTHNSRFDELEWHNISARGVPMLVFPFKAPSDSSFRHGHTGSAYPHALVDSPAFLGANSTFARSHFFGEVHIVMVIMQATAGFHFLRESVKSLKNEVLLFSDLGIYGEFADLQDKLWETSSAEKAVQLVDEALLAYFHKRPAFYQHDLTPVLDYLHHKDCRLKVGDLAKKFQCSERWLQLQFAEQTGLSPKAWIHLHRFRMATSYWEHNPGCSLLDIVAKFDYVDQSHLNRDFQKFSGNAPAFHFEHYGETERSLQINNPGVLVPKEKIA